LAAGQVATADFDVVRGWRGQQEDHLRASTTCPHTGVMNAVELDRFVQHYERLTRHILADMPGRADLVLPLHRDRSVRTPP
jgi:D-glycerate 3-kinase